MSDARQYKRPESVLVVVYANTGEVLLLRRRGTGFWQSVTGSLNWDEAPAHAAARELSEETGLPTTGLTDCEMHYRFVIYPIWRDRYAPGVVENTEYVFRLPVSAPLPVTTDAAEHDEYAWLQRNEALARIGSHTNIAAVRQWVPEVPEV